MTENLPKCVHCERDSHEVPSLRCATKILKPGFVRSIYPY